MSNDREENLGDEAMKEFEIEKINFGRIELGIDYEVLTITVINDSMNFIPYGRFFKKDIQEIIQMERSKKSVLKVIEEENVGILNIQESRKLTDYQDLYRLEKDMLDFDTAVDCGFGIVRILSGKYKNQYFLYNSENEEENIGFMLDVYLQIAVKEYDNKSLEKFIHSKDGRIMLNALQNTDDEEVLFDRLENAFISKKGGSNIIPFVK